MIIQSRDGNAPTRRSFLAGAGAAGLAAAIPARLRAQPDPTPILIRGAAIFDGRAPGLIAGSDVLIENGMISAVGPNLSTPEAEVIDASGLTLTPGLTDAHTHIMWQDEIEELIYGSPHEYTGAMAAEGARRMLLRGFTTVRDAGGPAFGLKRAIDSGVLAGPRILPSGFFISQTSGHGDFEPRLNYLSPHFTGQLDLAYLRGWTNTGQSSTAKKAASRDAASKLAQQRLSVLELARELGNVAEACRQRDMDRTSFYEWKRRFQTQGFEGLKDLPPIHKNHPQTTPPEVVERIKTLALEHPTYGCNRHEAMLALEGIRVSSITIQQILYEQGLGTKIDRWLALGATGDLGIELADLCLQLRQCPDQNLERRDGVGRQIAFWIFDDCSQRRRVGRPSWHDLSELAQMPSKCIDGLGPLPDQELAHAEHQRCALRLFALHRHETHRRTKGGLADRLGIGRILLLPLDEGLEIGGWDQPHVMAQLADLATPEMRTTTGFHRNDATR